MHVQEDLVYNKHSGHVVGFANLGEVNDYLLQLERSIEGNSTDRTLAKSMLVVMVKGLFSSL